MRCSKLLSAEWLETCIRSRELLKSRLDSLHPQSSVVPNRATTSQVVIKALGAFLVYST